LPRGPKGPNGPCGPTNETGEPPLPVTFKVLAVGSKRTAPGVVGFEVVFGSIKSVFPFISIPSGLIFKISTLPLWIDTTPVALFKVKSIALPLELSINSRLPDLGII
jgi:hypothetical protein